MESVTRYSRLVAWVGLAFSLPVGLHLLGTRAVAQSGTVTVNPAITHQTMGGWGADLSFTRNLNYISPDTRDQMVEEAVNDLGLTFLRCCFGRLSEPFNDNSDPRSINWSAFYDTAAVDHEVSAGLGLFKQKVEANGEPPTFLLNKDWEDEAPGWMNHAEFAETTAAMILYLRDRHGIEITFTSIDNEPGTFDSYTPSVQQAMIKVMGPAFQAFGLPTKIALAEGISAQRTWSYVDQMKNDSAIWPHVGLINWHLYGTNDPFRSYLRDFARTKGIPTGQTEFPATINDLINDLTSGGVSYWTRYHLSGGGRGPTAGGFGSTFVADWDGTSFWRNTEYWKFRQFMRYVRPGAVRIEANSTVPSIRSFAFSHSGRTTVVLVNTGGEASFTVQGLPAGIYGVSQAVGGQVYSERGIQSVSGSGVTVTVPGGSILTVYPYAGTNQKPIVTDWRATPGFLNLPATSINLTSSAQDVEREPLTFSWSVKSRPEPAAVSVGSPNSASTAASGLTVPGEYVFTVTVRDGAGQATARDVIVRVYSGNQPPFFAEGHRYYKDERLILPDSSVAYGPLFINALDREGDAVTTSFSVVSQPPGANAVFSGTSVSGLTVPGTYTFRFTASDPTHTVHRDFTQLVVSATGSTSRRPEVGVAAMAAPGGAGLVAQTASVDPHLRPPAIAPQSVVQIGDMLLTTEQLEALRSSAGADVLVTTGDAAPIRAWDSGVIPYEISPDFTTAQRRNILAALKEWSRVAGLVITPRTTQLGHLLITRDQAKGSPAYQCFSFVGQFMRGAPVRTNLGATCADAVDVTYHEIGHALGLQHQHNRPDRDAYVEIDFTNIVEGSAQAFGRFNIPVVGPYDFGSIMNDDGRVLARDATRPVVSPRPRYASSARVLGQQTQPSDTDHEALKLLYDVQPSASGAARPTESPPPASWRDDALLAMERLHAFYMSHRGLHRAEGLLAGGRPDFPGIAQWIGEVYLGARSAGWSAASAFDIVRTAITQSDEWRQKNPARQPLTPPPFQAALSLDRGELVRIMNRLDHFYRAPEGLQRPEGLSLDGGPDFLSLATWIFDVYLNERRRGTSESAAWVLTENAIKATDEWRRRH
jgi:O-glycosyl hydrolase